MNILIAGNMANLGYAVAKQLRKNGLNTTLLMNKNPKSTSDPLITDPSLKGNYPDWIIFYDTSRRFWYFDIIKEMRKSKYHLIQANVELPIFAYFSQRPFLVQTQGSDLRELAFSNSLRGFLLRHAYKKAKILLHSSPDFFSLFPKLGLQNDLFLPIPLNHYFFSPQNFAKDSQENFMIFHPTNLEWRLKGNDIFIKGFARFSQNHPNSLLVIIDRGIDSQRTHQLVKSLGIENKIKFIHGPLNPSQLLEYYNSSDVVADQFIIPGLGAIALEALSCEKPLVTYCPSNIFKDGYLEPPPLLTASTISEITEKLEILIDRKFRLELGQRARSWIQKFHSPEIYVKKLKTVYESILNHEDPIKIRNKISKISIEN